MDPSHSSVDLADFLNSINPIFNVEGQGESSVELDPNLLTPGGFSPTSVVFGDYATLPGDDEIYATLGLEPKKNNALETYFTEGELSESLNETSLQQMSPVLLTPNSGMSTNQFEYSQPLTLSTPESEDSEGSFLAPARRNTRKSSITTRQASASPSMEEIGSSSPARGLKTRSRTIKKEVVDTTPAVRKCAIKRPATSPASAAAGKADDSKTAKVKMYEIEDDPKCKNAKAAKANREKKKNLMDNLQQQNNELTAKNDEMALRMTSVEESNNKLREELEQMKRKNLAATGLKRVLKSAKDVLEEVMPPLIKKYGKWTIEAAPWFEKVDVSGIESKEIQASLINMNPTSDFITLHFNTTQKVVKVDYRPEDPVLPNVMPL